MVKRIYLKNGKRYYLPWGFHLNEDLLPLLKLKEALQRDKNLSKEAKLRLKWFDFYQKTKNVSLTCRRFGISRKTFYYWKKRYNPFNLKTLEDRPKIPKKKRKPEITFLQEQRIIALRKKYPRYSKFKIAILYEKIYKEKISSWKVQRTIQKYKLYFQPQKIAKITKKRQKAKKKKRITELKKEKRAGVLLCLDVIVIYWNSLKRYIFTAIDYYSKIAFARMYTTKSSKSAQDFLKRLYFLYQGKIENIQTDNGSEFQGYFEKTLKELPKRIQRYFSRPKTPKDNPVNENFNGTLKREFLSLGNFTPDPQKFNQLLTEWLIEYNFNRPHQALGYKTPIEFHFQHQKVLPMCSSSASI